MNIPLWDRLPPTAKDLIKSSLIPLIVAAIALWCAYIAAENVVRKIIKEQWFIEATIDQIGKNFVGASYHAYFYMGRDNDAPQYSIPLYVSQNQEVEIYIKATHYTQGDNKNLRDVDVFVGGKRMDRVKISSSPDYKKGFSLTDSIKEAMEETSWDFTKNIQHVEFRVAPTKEKNSNFVLIETLIITVGIPKKNDGGRQ